MADHRLVLPDSFEEKDFASRAHAQGWLWVKEIAESEGQPYESIYRDPNRDAWLHFVDDGFRGARFLIVHGTDAGAILDAVKRAVPWVQPEAVLDDSAQRTDRDRRIIGLLRLSVAAEELGEARVRPIFEAAAESEDAGVLD